MVTVEEGKHGELVPETGDFHNEDAPIQKTKMDGNLLMGRCCQYKGKKKYEEKARKDGATILRLMWSTYVTLLPAWKEVASRLVTVLI